MKWMAQNLPEFLILPLRCMHFQKAITLRVIYILCLTTIEYWNFFECVSDDDYFYIRD